MMYDVRWAAVHAAVISSGRCQQSVCVYISQLDQLLEGGWHYRTWQPMNEADTELPSAVLKTQALG